MSSYQTVTNINQANLVQQALKAKSRAVPPAYLRSSLRALLSQGPGTQKLFVEHARSRLQETPPQLTEASKLFPAHDACSPECIEYLALTRCLFSSKLASESLTYLTHFVESIIRAHASWTAQSPLSQHVDKFAGDTVQAMQALKESAPEKSTKLKEDLQALLASFASCQTYCASSGLEYPFSRAERQARDTLQLFFADAAAAQQAPSSHGDRIINLASPPAGAVEKFALGNRHLPRLFNGLWQLSSPAFGVGNWHQQQRKLVKLVEAGLVAADMADHYGDAELVYGDFRNRLPAATQAEIYAATKWCVFKPLNAPVTTEYVLAAVRERCRRLGGRVDLLQFHWYDLTFHPPPKKCGGLLTEKWVNQPPPDIYSPSNPLNPSQRKYLDMINHWGTWQEFQSLLGTLSLLATKYNVSIADVASRWVLQQPSVGAVLVGTRLGVSDRCADALHVFGWNLSNADIMAIDAFAHGNNGEKLHAVYQKIGDCGQEYRGMRA
ncbi:aldo/keto reductase/Endoribonuclease L-PSP [Metarhizium acridum CQMa 102]|uniref:Aldo/keto reductase/Endoribonuclease L-PSP n=1 Tax=Metarhizium acridum (strain CQMa 102) TaxID=655827 RepID=E9E6T0_METAQ|nr:aldo/keto reductase/Endoribonuclease L-PSP [Metarhizium acridum CQMa 102]EFY88369.1 aldo/keto reductase/Endoribonuclease L-PSP [Metarhizium acridum CQMa 102]